MFKKSEVVAVTLIIVFSITAPLAALHYDGAIALFINTIL